MFGFVRDVGIAIGSLAAAALVVWLLGPVLAFFVPPASQPLLALILGGLIFADILRREHRGSGGRPVASA